MKIHNIYCYFCCCTKLATRTSDQAFLNMDRIQLTGNGSKLNLLGKIREITSSELIFGGLQLFGTSVLPCMHNILRSGHLRFNA